MAHREAHRVKDTATGKIYPAKAAAGRELAHLVGGPRKTLSSGSRSPVHSLTVSSSKMKMETGCA